MLAAHGLDTGPGRARRPGRVVDAARRADRGGSVSGRPGRWTCAWIARAVRRWPSGSATVDAGDAGGRDLAFGEERRSRRVARAIVAAAIAASCATRRALASVVRRAAGGGGWQRIDPATRTFQALRIWVNDELAGLADVSRDGAGVSGPRAATRPSSRFTRSRTGMVKHRFRRAGRRCHAFRGVLTRRPVIAGRRRARDAIRARAAHTYVCWRGWHEHRRGIRHQVNDVRNNPVVRESRRATAVANSGTRLAAGVHHGRDAALLGVAALATRARQGYQIERLRGSPRGRIAKNRQLRLNVERCRRRSVIEAPRHAHGSAPRDAARDAHHRASPRDVAVRRARCPRAEESHADALGPSSLTVKKRRSRLRRLVRAMQASRRGCSIPAASTIGARRSKAAGAAWSSAGCSALSPSSGLWAAVLEARLVRLQVFKHEAFLAERPPSSRSRSRSMPSGATSSTATANMLAPFCPGRLDRRRSEPVEHPATTVTALCAALGDCTPADRPDLVRRLSGKGQFTVVRQSHARAPSRSRASAR